MKKARAHLGCALAFPYKFSQEQSINIATDPKAFTPRKKSYSAIPLFCAAEKSKSQSADFALAFFESCIVKVSCKDRTHIWHYLYICR
jgi:hypothetical protein